MLDALEFDYLMRTRGWLIIENMIEPAFLDRLGEDLEKAIARSHDYRARRGLLERSEGSAHHVFGFNDSLDELLRRNYLNAEISHYLGGKIILNSYGGIANQTSDTTYYKRPHRDVRVCFPGHPMMVTVMVLIDDFTLDNGATHLLSSSHHVVDRPSDEWFEKYSARLVGRRGSLGVFDSAIWHAAGENRVGVKRRGLTLTYTRPFFKQQLDYPRYLSSEYEQGLDDDTRQLLGYNARVPANLDEWYQPAEQRTYRADQD
ncbi:MAG: phytanoyl-CoA dioxygenase family protein [Planctomycetaceae bacterium]|nr:phytanoyl-CoA dioxygenase family protein [Planctomycetaceae bacterium]